MKEDILQFRQICSFLFKEKGYSQKRVIDETKLSQCSIAKLLYGEPERYLMMNRATIEKMKDFNKRHAQYLSFAAAEETTPKPDRKEEEQPGKGKDDKDFTSITNDLIKILRKLSAELPSSVQINIKING